eukprot:360643-Chlamydomonas_euryale.AAC.1
MPTGPSPDPHQQAMPTGPSPDTHQHVTPPNAIWPHPSCKAARRRCAKARPCQGGIALPRRPGAAAAGPRCPAAGVLVRGVTYCRSSSRSPSVRRACRPVWPAGAAPGGRTTGRAPAGWTCA